MAAPADQPLWPYALWAAVGVLVGLGVVGILTIGIFALALAAVLAITGLIIPACRTRAALAAVPALGLLPLMVALNNLNGPGERCWSTATASGCDGLLDPWPFAIPALVLIAGGCWLLWRFGRPASTP